MPKWLNFAKSGHTDQLSSVPQSLALQNLYSLPARVNIPNLCANYRNKSQWHFKGDAAIKLMLFLLARAKAFWGTNKCAWKGGFRERVFKGLNHTNCPRKN